MAESERMRQELEELQKKISKLNVNRDVGSTEVGIGGGATNNAPNVPSSSERRLPLQPATEKDELAKELQMIESTIRERENEITVNQLRMAAAAGGGSGVDGSGAPGGFALDGVDYGLSGGPAGGKAAAAAQFAEGIATAAAPKWEAAGGGGGEGALSRMRVGRG